ncbi:hypothetical protein FOL47_001038, partial [Perkinsus chesapeaki]
HVEAECFKKKRDKGEQVPSERLRYPTSNTTVSDSMVASGPISRRTPSCRPTIQAVSLKTAEQNPSWISDSCTTEVIFDTGGSVTKAIGLVESGSSISLIDVPTLARLPVDVKVNRLDSPCCTTATRSSLVTIGAVVLLVKLGNKKVEHKFYVSSSTLVYPVILGRDILTTCRITITFDSKPRPTTEPPIVALNEARCDQENWKQLPKDWVVDEIVLENNDIYIVAAKHLANDDGMGDKHRFYVGINPALVPKPSRAEQLGGLKPQPALRKADSQAKEAADKCFKQWIEEGRLQPTKLDPSTSTTNWYVVGGDTRRYRPVFTFTHLNRHLRRAFGRRSPFAQNIAVLIEKARCYKRLVVNDVKDAYMHLWVLPSNRHLYTVNIAPFDDSPSLYEFWCLPYGPSHCPRCLECVLQWLLQKHMDIAGDFQQLFYG